MREGYRCKDTKKGDMIGIVKNYFVNLNPAWRFRHVKKCDFGCGELLYCYLCNVI